MTPAAPKARPAWAVAALCLALLLNHLAGAYVDARSGLAPVRGDLLLGVLPVMDLRRVYLWGFGLFAAMALWQVFRRERGRVAHIAWLYALLIALRSGLMILTPLEVPEGSLPMGGLWAYDAVGRFFTGKNDLFFSLHTALPFLGSLIFSAAWFRGVSLAVSVAMAAVVLLGRHHYSIDVAGAYLITYGLFHLERSALGSPFLPRLEA